MSEVHLLGVRQREGEGKSGGGGCIGLGRVAPSIDRGLLHACRGLPQACGGWPGGTVLACSLSLELEG